ncbi:MAG: arabinofuranosidase, partial [Gordonia sp. (in: high G+C Gram-positive bacteria)]
HATARSLTGPNTFVPVGDWGDKLEGPAVTRLPNGDWRIYLDAYTRGEYLYSDSSDGMKTWSPTRQLPGLSGIVRHVGVLREPVR